MATDAERAVLAEKILAPIARNASRLRDKELTGFLAMKGKRFDRGLMIVGRATNGWIKQGFTPHVLGDPSVRDNHAREVQQASLSEDGSCPMLWITEEWHKKRHENGYSTGRSAFWRTVRASVKNMRIADVENADWPSHIVWSNLYKVSSSKGGNPSEGLCNIQLQGCIELLRLELSIFRPTRLLFVTGENWARPFLSGAKLRKGSGTHVQEFGYLDDIRCVVAVRPERKPELPWVDEVVKAFGHL